MKELTPIGELNRSLCQDFEIFDQLAHDVCVPPTVMLEILTVGVPTPTGTD